MSLATGRRSLVVIGVASALVLTGCSSKPKTVSGTGNVGPVSSAAASNAAIPSGVPAVAGPGASFNGVTVGNALNLKSDPKVTASSKDVPTELQYEDLVTGSGKAATPTSTVNVEYVGVRLADGLNFDSSWSRGTPTSFPLTGVVPGFTQGIGGTAAIPAMKEGGRRIMILPASLAYGASGAGADIPPNTPLVFVVDLLSVS